MVVHLIVRDDGEKVRPACRDWSGSLHWTVVLEAVTCPRCRGRVAAGPPGMADASASAAAADALPRSE